MKRRMPSHRNDLPKFTNGAQFDALSASDKERVAAYYEQGKHLTKADRAFIDAEKKKMGRPTIGEGVKVISVSIERSLLREVDRYAKATGLKRAQIIAQGLKNVVGGSRRSSRRKSA